MTPAKTSRMSHTAARFILMGALATCLPVAAKANWVPNAAGTYNYSTAANWTDGTINNIFLPSDYTGGSQTVVITSTDVWNSSTGITTSATNAQTLLFTGSTSNLNLTLGGDINFVTTGSTATTNNSLLQFGTTTANKLVNFTINKTVAINVDSNYSNSSAVIFDGTISGTGGIVKNGNGGLYFQNAAQTFTGALTINSGQTILSGAAASLATQTINIGRQDTYLNSTNHAIGVMGSLVLGNGYAVVGTSSGSTGNNNDRISDTATVNMTGGGIQVINNGGVVTETIGTVNLNRGGSSLLLSSQTTGSTSLNITNLNRSSGATLLALATNYNGTAFAASALGTSSTTTLTAASINGQDPSASVINGIIPWAIYSTMVTANTWASGVMSTSGSTAFLTYGANGFTPQTTYATDVNTAGATENVAITASQTLAANRTINSLTINGTAEVAGTGKTLTLTSGAILYNAAQSGNGGRAQQSVNFDFNGQEAIIYSGLGKLLLAGNLTNTGGNGLTFTGLGYSNSGYAQLWLMGNNTYTGPTTISSGLLQILGTNALPANSPVVINEGGGIDLEGRSIAMASLSGVGYVEGVQSAAGTTTPASTTTGTSTLTVGSANTNTEYAGQIRNGGAGNFVMNLAKTGTGTLKLTGTNTYTGTTAINGGTLSVNGSLSTSSVVTVNNGGTLAGSGTVGAVTVASGGHFAPGNSITTAFTTGSLTLAAGSVTDIELGTASTIAASSVNDRTTVNGTLGLGGTLNLVDNAGANSQGVAGAGQYQIFTGFTGTATGSFSSVNNITGYHAKVDSSTAGAVYVNNYQIAAGNTLTPTVNLGITHVGQGFTNAALSIQNTATSNGYAEGLNATKGATTGAATLGGSDISNLSGGSTSTAITVGLNDTATAGLKTGTAKVGFASNGTVSGYSNTTLSDQTVTVNGQVNYYADPTFTQGTGGTLTSTDTTHFTLDLGSFNNDSGIYTATITLDNVLHDAIYQDLLAGGFDVSGAGVFSLDGFNATFSELASGSNLVLTVSFNTAGATAGTYTGSVLLNPTSVNTSGTESLSAVSLGLEITVVPEPATWSMIVGGLGMMALAQRARRRMS